MSHQGQPYRKPSDGKFFPNPTVYQGAGNSHFQNPHDQRYPHNPENLHAMSNYSIPPEHAHHSHQPSHYHSSSRQQYPQSTQEQYLTPIQSLPQAQRDKFKQNYWKLAQDIIKFRGQQITPQIAKSQQDKATSIEMTFYQHSQSVEEYQQKCYEYLKKIHQQQKQYLSQSQNQQQPLTFEQLLQSFHELINYMPTLQYIIDKYNSIINDIETKCLDIKISKEEENTLLTQKTKLEQRVSYFKRIIDEIRKGLNHQLDAQGIEKFSNMVQEYLKFCHTDSIQDCYRFLQSEGYKNSNQSSNSREFHLGKRTYQQSQSRPYNGYESQHSFSKGDYQLKRQRVDELNLIQRIVPSTNYTTSDSHLNQRIQNHTSFQAQQPQSYERVNCYLSKHGITKSNDHIQHIPAYQQNYQAPAVTTNPAYSHISQAYQLGQQQQSQEIQKLKSKPQMSCNQLIDQLKKYQGSTTNQVIDLKDLKNNSFEQQMISIQNEHEKRNRSGTLLGQIMANVSVNFDEFEEQDEDLDDRRRGKFYAYKIYQQRRITLEKNVFLTQQKDLASGDGEEMQNQTYPEDQSRQQPQQNFALKVKQMLQRIKDRMINIDEYDKDNMNFAITLSKDESDINKKKVYLYIDCQIEKAFVTGIHRTNKLIKYQEYVQNLRIEFDIDNFSVLFEDDFFDQNLKTRKNSRCPKVE